MILESVVDGLKIILGNFVTQIALLITMLVYGRPPPSDGIYADFYGTHAKEIFYQNVLGSIFFAGCTYMDLFHYNNSVAFSVLGILFQMIILAEINQDFLFSDVDIDFFKMTED